MVEKKSWEEFRDSKLLWFVNRSLHLFGWSIVVVIDDDNVITDVYPARVKFRGFSESAEETGFIGLTQYLKDNIDELTHETKL